MGVPATVETYYDVLTAAFKELVGERKLEGTLIDCANGQHHLTSPLSVPIPLTSCSHKSHFLLPPLLRPLLSPFIRGGRRNLKDPDVSGMHPTDLNASNNVSTRKANNPDQSTLFIQDMASNPPP